MPSFILIRATIWPQYTNVTDRQTDRQTGQRSDSIGPTVIQRVHEKTAPPKYNGLVFEILGKHH